LIPVKETNWLFWIDYYSNIPLQWDDPDCGNCEARGGRCGLVGDDALRLACYDLPTQGEIVNDVLFSLISCKFRSYLGFLLTFGKFLFLDCFFFYLLEISK